MRALVLLVLAGCGDKPAPAAPTPPTASMLDCARVADHVATTVSASKPRPGATHARINELVTTRCEADAWTYDTKECMYGIKTVAEGRACASSMTDEQRTALKNQAKALRGNANEPVAEAEGDDWIRHVVQDEPDSVPR